MSAPQAPAAAYNLLTLPANSSQRRFAFLIGAILLILSIAAIPYIRVQLPELQAYQPALFSTGICFELITAYVFFTQFWIERSPAILVLVAGYLYSCGMSLMYLLTFPNTFTPTGLFHAGTQTAPWLYLLWHGGFPLSILLYVAVDAKYGKKPLSVRIARWLSIAVPAAVCGMVAGFTYVTTALTGTSPAGIPSSVPISY